MKKMLIGAVTAGLLLVGATGVLAATFKSPAEIYADIKGLPVEEVYTERAAGQSFGELAEEAGILDEFKANMLENRKAVIQERVANGQLTQEQAEIMIQNMEANQAVCNGNGMYGRYGAGDRGQGLKGAFGQGQNGARGFMAQGGCWGLQGNAGAAGGASN